VFDAIEIEKRGIPTITIVHDTFARAAELHARVLGLKDIPVVIEPAPDSGVVGEHVEAFADETLEQVVSALVSNAAAGPEKEGA
jgi:hypothetical protein